MSNIIDPTIIAQIIIEVASAGRISAATAVIIPKKAKKYCINFITFQFYI